MIEKAPQRILVVEDEMIVAMMLEELLVELGYVVIGPAFSVEEAMQLACENDPDLALLDVNLDGAPSFPVADFLRGRGVPFVFASGYGTRGLTERYVTAPMLKKPFSQEQLQEALAAA